MIDLNGPEIDLNTVRGISLEFICTGAAGGNVEVQAGFFRHPMGCWPASAAVTITC